MTALQNAKILFSRHKHQCAEHLRIAEAAKKSTSESHLGSWRATAQKSFEDQKRAQRA